eukprot:CAMPEP_0172475734 /NCGR_PEP_ID=MMETSP1065-20121228/70021_1 /TAXON_ID=265537 /ORGANISM="Amphiprora paludosa, Strain CCMP125" /LENGTH=402 /DNA_ID=CAMNT_0013233947 /DNA_START=224 /DNA_END=1432 /DNA_ORIENTATION=-
MARSAVYLAASICLALESVRLVDGFAPSQRSAAPHTGDRLKLFSSFSQSSFPNRQNNNFDSNGNPAKKLGEKLARRAGLGTYSEEDRPDRNLKIFSQNNQNSNNNNNQLQRTQNRQRYNGNNNNNNNRQQTRVSTNQQPRIFPERNNGGSQYKSQSKPVQGSSLKTWSFLDPAVERVRVVLETDGRPLNAEVDLWEGPDNTPYKMRAYVENGKLCPFNIVIDTPSSPNTIAVRNQGLMEFPISAYVAEDEGDYNAGSAELLTDPSSSSLYVPRIVQGGAVRAFPMDSFVENVQVLLKSDGRPLNARVEFLQGPNNVKQVIEFYADDGLTRPLYAVIETPGSGNVVRVVNRAPMEYPLVAWVEPLMVGRPRHDDAGGFVVDGVLEPWYEIATRAATRVPMNSN